MAKRDFKVGDRVAIYGRNDFGTHRGTGTITKISERGVDIDHDESSPFVSINNWHPKQLRLIKKRLPVQWEGIWKYAGNLKDHVRVLVPIDPGFEKGRRYKGYSSGENQMIPAFIIVAACVLGSGIAAHFYGKPEKVEKVEQVK